MSSFHPELVDRTYWKGIELRCSAHRPLSCCDVQAVFGDYSRALC